MLLHHESQASQLNQGGHPYETMGSLTQYQASLLPHSNSKEAVVFPLLLMEGEELPVQDLVCSSVNSTKHFFRTHEASSSWA